MKRASHIQFTLNLTQIKKNIFDFSNIKIVNVKYKRTDAPSL